MLRAEASRIMGAVREKRPLVHHITNYVTVNDCANIAICAGAAPVMADAAEEMEEMVSIASALVLNIGTLNERILQSMLLAGRTANRLGIPVLVDPVGAGATTYRSESVQMLLRELDVAVLKGNSGEIASLAGEEALVVGVDSHGMSGDPAEVCQSFAARLGCTVVMTGEVDYISDGERSYVVEGGDPLMESVSGTGCMAATVVAAFCAVEDDRALASASALAVMSTAAEIAAVGAKGPMSFKAALFDALAALTSEGLEGGAALRRTR